MNIAIFCATLPPYPCGVGRHTHYLAEGLVGLGHKVTVVTLAGTKPLPGSYSVDASLKKFGLLEYIRWARRNRAARYEVVHLQYPTKLNRRGVSVVSLPWVLRIFGFRAVLTLHELTEASRLGQFRNILLTIGFRKVILPNPADRQFLNWRKGVFHIPLGACLPLLDHPQPIHHGMVAFLGFLDGSKGEEEALRALALCPKDQGIKLVFLSGVDPATNVYHAYLKNLTTELKVGGMVEWLSRVDDQTLVHRLSQAEIVLLPFRRGVTPRNSTLIEALSMGKPTVVAVTDQSPDYLRDDLNCLIVEPGNPQQLAEALQRLLADPALLQRLSTGALEAAAAFQWPSIAQRTVAVYKQ